MPHFWAVDASFLGTGFFESFLLGYPAFLDGLAKTSDESVLWMLAVALKEKAMIQ